MTYFKKVRQFLIVGALVGIATPAQAVNWLMLQGTERPGASERAHLWGFVQPEFQRTDGSSLPAGPWAGQSAVFNQIAPDQKTHETFNIRRARIGVRGTAVPIDSQVNYFLLTEFGNNGITRSGGGSASLTDASITLNHIPGARIRAGLFKYPGSEEGLKAIHVFDYVNFSNFGDQLLLERFFDSSGGVDSDDPNRPNGPVGAFRDIGVQVFDAFKYGDWEHSYALMVGNGNGITRGANNAKRESYVYLSTERIFGGQGPRQQGVKGYVWHQDGVRTLVAGPDSGDYDRTRYGAGTTYRRGAWRAGAEYVRADGMIFNGTQGGAVAGTRNNADTATASFLIRPEGRANGWYVDAGYTFAPGWQADVRYDVLNRSTDDAAAERKFETVTLGVTHFFNPRSRVTLNYEIRSAEAPNLPDAAVPNQILDAIDDRLSAQLIVIF